MAAGSAPQAAGEEDLAKQTAMWKQYQLALLD